MHLVDLKEKFWLLNEHWRPKIVAELNAQEVKIVKFRGVFPWHHHDEVDELFFVWKGAIQIECRDRIIELKSGQMCVVPRGVEHRTLADAEAEVIIFEPSGVKNTGNVDDPHFTAPTGAKL